MKKNKLKIDPDVLALALVSGILMIIIDALLDAFLFGEETFLDQLLSPNLFEIYVRGVLIATFLIFGFITSRTIYKLKLTKEAQSKLVLDGQKANEELQKAFANIKTLSEMLPICSYCKKIRNDKGYWEEVATYISKHTDTLFSHGMCPECEKKAYEGLEKLKNEKS